MMFVLRDYQQELMSGIRQSMLAGHKSIMVQSFPRTGKTVVMAEVARQAVAKGKTVLVTVHRKEVLAQIEATCEAHMGKNPLMTFKTIQALARKPIEAPDVLIIDESHRVLSQSYKKLLEACPRALKFMFTATPTRLNGEGFEKYVDDLICGKSIKWLQQNGNIAPFKYYGVSLIKDEDQTVRNGDFAPTALKPKIYGDVLSHYKRLADGKSAICYVHTVESADELAVRFWEHGYSAEAVSCKTPPKKRAQILEDFKNGNLKILLNVELFTEGVDLPNCDVCLMLRPTQSLSLYIQFSTRALNPREGKTAILIDFTENYQRHGLPDMEREWSLKGKKAEHKKYNVQGELVIKTCDDCYGCFEAKEKHCPYCGAVPKLTSREIEVIKEIELQEISKRQEEKLRQKVRAYAMPEQCQTVDELKMYRDLKGYKNGWLWHQLKQRNWRI